MESETASNEFFCKDLKTMKLKIAKYDVRDIENDKQIMKRTGAKMLTDNSDCVCNGCVLASPLEKIRVISGSDKMMISEQHVSAIQDFEEFCQQAPQSESKI